MTYQVPSTVVSSLPLRAISTFEPSKRYSLFKKIDNRWFQVRVQTWNAEMAVKVWADFVARNPLSYSIRPASFDCNEAK